jgi:drug/metabolite transporter (DMT)-like permease
VRRLGAAGEPAPRTVFYFSLISTMGAGALIVLTQPWSAWHWPGLAYVVAVGVCATAAQLAMTKAYQVGDTLMVASLAYWTVLLSSLLGMWLWRDMLPWSAYLGIALIVIGGIWAILSGRRLAS